MGRCCLLTGILFCCLSPVRSQERADTTGIIIGVGVGVAYQPIDLDAFNARLSDAHLHGAPDLSPLIGLHFYGHGRRLLLDFSENYNIRKEKTDTSVVRSGVVDLQLCAGYPLIRNTRMVLAPMIGYRFSLFNYAHYMDPPDHAFNAALRSSSEEVQLNLSKHSLVLGVFWSYGRTIGVAVQAGYVVPFGDGTWHSTGTNTKLKDGPTIDQGPFIMATFRIQRKFHPERLP